MSFFKNMFGGKKAEPAPTTSESIQKLRDTENMLLKKQEFLETKLEQELKIAKENASSNKRGKFSPSRRSSVPNPNWMTFVPFVWTFSLVAVVVVLWRIAPNSLNWISSRKPFSSHLLTFFPSFSGAASIETKKALRAAAWATSGHVDDDRDAARGFREREHKCGRSGHDEGGRRCAEEDPQRHERR